MNNGDQKMGKEILILGAGFGGLEAATGLRQQLDDSHRITLIDKNDSFVIGFNKFDVMFGRRSPESVKSYYQDIAAEGVTFIQDTVKEIDLINKQVKTTSAEFPYDYLIVALGADLAPEAIPGFVTGGHHFYSLEGAERLRPIIETFQAGTILITIFGAPYKCPPAPFEAAFQLHDYFVHKGIRDNITLKVLTPAPSALPVSPTGTAEVERRLKERGIPLLTGHHVTSLEPEKRQAIVEGHDPVSYDLFLGVPLHVPPPVVRQSAFGGWITVNHDNLETQFTNVYAVGDVTKIPVGAGAVPKAGAFAEAAAKEVVKDIVNKILGRNDPVKFEGIGACLLEFGAGEIARLEANFLATDTPGVILVGPSADFRRDKEEFESTRKGRWFNQ
jgi:sulfide:quinone oxidoreductase